MKVRTGKGDFWVFFLFMFDIQHCFICRPADSTVSVDAGIEPRAVAITALAVRALTTRLDLIHFSARSHPQLGYISVENT